jgi:hypothetical protein
MRRGTVLLLSVAVGLLLAASSASAKGAHAELVISGRSLATPITIKGEPSLIWLTAAGFGQIMYRSPLDGAVETPGLALGPAFRARFRLDVGCGWIHQILYPYAPGGPQVFTPGRQTACGAKVSPGYWPAPTSFYGTLVANGLPDRGAIPATAGSPTSSAGRLGSDTGFVSWSIVRVDWAAVASLGVVLAAGVGLLVLVRRRRHPIV